MGAQRKPPHEVDEHGARRVRRRSEYERQVLGELPLVQEPEPPRHQVENGDAGEVGALGHGKAGEVCRGSAWRVKRVKRYRRRVSQGLRLILFDRTCQNRAGFGLSRAWSTGSRMYSLLGRSDGVHGARSFADALTWLSSFRATEPIAELQFWGHGKWGRIFIDREALDRSALAPGHEHHPALCRLRERLVPDALVWVRTCETFGAGAGHDFSGAWTGF